MPNRSREAVLRSVMAACQVRASIVADARYCGRWYEQEPQGTRGLFHLIDQGECWVRGEELSAPLHLKSGDLVVFAQGSAHTLCGQMDDAGASAEDRFTTLLCGELDFVSPARHPLLRALPPSFVVRADDGGDSFRQLAGLLLDIARQGVFGQQIILDKLADSLFVMAVCAYTEQARDARGLLAALADERLARALAALHAEPGRDWRVETLADLAGMSRTTFATTFSEALGQGPIQYLTEWRVSEARRLLADRRLSVAQIAEQLGYQSEAAFRRAYKRVEGTGPGEVRRLK